MATLGSLAVGSKIKVPHKVYGDVIFKVADHNHDGYPANSTTLIAEKIVVYRCFDAKESSNPNSYRSASGNSRYSVSNIDQWLNSSAPAGQWYSAQHAYDAPPTNDNVSNGYNDYDQDAGFLNGFQTQFIGALKSTTIKVALISIDGGGSEDITRKVFLASRAEVFGTAENGIMEGSRIAIFADDSASGRIAEASAYAVSHNEYTTLPNTKSWMLRSPFPNNTVNVRHIANDGSLGNNVSCSGATTGVRPLCNLDSGVFVSDEPDTNGFYSIDPAAPYFTYDGASSSTFGLQIASFNGMAPESVEEIDAYAPTLTEIKVPSLPRFYHGGVGYDSAPQYQFTVVSQEELAPTDRSAILSWLIGRKSFKPMVFHGYGSEMSDVVYYCVFTAASVVFVNGRCHGFNFTITFDSPFARKASTVATTTSGTHTITVVNNSDVVDGYVYPTVDFVGSSISIINTTDDEHRAFEFSGLEATEQMHVDCENKIITSNLSGEKLSKFTSKNWLRLRKGENTLVVVSQGDVTITCPCYVMVGFGG